LFLLISVTSPDKFQVSLPQGHATSPPTTSSSSSSSSTPPVSIDPDQTTTITTTTATADQIKEAQAVEIMQALVKQQGFELLSDQATVRRLSDILTFYMHSPSLARLGT